MLKTPLKDQPFIRDYLEVNRSLFGLNYSIQDDRQLVFTYDIDYHNFIIFIKHLGILLKNAGMSDIIKEDIKFFIELLRENVFTPVVRKFHAQMSAEGHHGDMAELYEACDQYYITLHDFINFIKKSPQYFEDKVTEYGGKQNADIFNEMLAEYAQSQFITIENSINPYSWHFYFHHSNHKCKVFETIAEESLFTDILTPAMRYLYANFKD